MLREANMTSIYESYNNLCIALSQDGVELVPPKHDCKCYGRGWIGVYSGDDINTPGSVILCKCIFKDSKDFSKAFITVNNRAWRRRFIKSMGGFKRTRRGNIRFTPKKRSK